MNINFLSSVNGARFSSFSCLTVEKDRFENFKAYLLMGENVNTFHDTRKCLNYFLWKEIDNNIGQTVLFWYIYVVIRRLKCYVYIIVDSFCHHCLVSVGHEYHAYRIKLYFLAPPLPSSSPLLLPSLGVALAFRFGSL